MRWLIIYLLGVYIIPEVGFIAGLVEGADACRRAAQAIADWYSSDSADGVRSDLTPSRRPGNRSRA